jgi:hypothetical protein
MARDTFNQQSLGTTLNKTVKEVRHDGINQSSADVTQDVRCMTLIQI